MNKGESHYIFSEIQSCQKNVVGHGSISILDTYTKDIVLGHIIERMMWEYIQFVMVSVKVVTRNLVGGSPVANVIKSCKACTINIVDTMIWHKKVLFPSHINVVLIGWIIDKTILIEYIRIRFERWEAFLREKHKVSVEKFLLLSQSLPLTQ